MIKKLILCCVATLILTACANTKTYRKPPYNAPSDDATIKLAEAANAVSDSMFEIARLEKVIIPPGNDNLLTIPSSYNLQTRASIDWSGPIVELVERVAKAGNYTTRVLGNAPSIPVLISISLKDTSLAEILRDIDYQAGRKASIHVYPNSRIVELRYAKAYS